MGGSTTGFGPRGSSGILLSIIHRRELPSVERTCMLSDSDDMLCARGSFLKVCGVAILS